MSSCVLANEGCVLVLMPKRWDSRLFSLRVCSSTLILQVVVGRPSVNVLDGGRTLLIISYFLSFNRPKLSFLMHRLKSSNMPGLVTATFGGWTIICLYARLVSLSVCSIIDVVVLCWISFFYASNVNPNGKYGIASTRCFVCWWIIGALMLVSLALGTQWLDL